MDPRPFPSLFSVVVLALPLQSLIPHTFRSYSQEVQQQGCDLRSWALRKLKTRIMPYRQIFLYVCVYGPQIVFLLRHLPKHVRMLRVITIVFRGSCRMVVCQHRPKIPYINRAVGAQKVTPNFGKLCTLNTPKYITPINTITPLRNPLRL